MLYKKNIYVVYPIKFALKPKKLPNIPKQKTATDNGENNIFFTK